jgi:uncharacterized protein (TIGR03790 family)
MRRFWPVLPLLCSLAPLLPGQPGAAVLIVVNQPSALSRQIGEYYAEHRSVPSSNICRLNASTNEEISRSEYDDQIARPIGDYLRAHHLVEKTLYIVTTSGVPLKIRGNLGLGGEAAAVDSELTLLYSDLHGRPHSLPGGIPNPFFSKTGAVFRHPDFPIYLVTRLAG